MHRTLVRALMALIVVSGATWGLPAAASAQGLPWYPWQSLPLEPLPANAEAHEWDAEVSVDPNAPSNPIDLLGSADLAVRRSIAIPHWTRSISPMTSTTASVGSTKSTGTVGDWDVYFTMYDTNLPIFAAMTGTSYRCTYHASVIGTYRNPVVTELSPPACGLYRRKTVLVQ